MSSRPSALRGRRRVPVDRAFERIRSDRTRGASALAADGLRELSRVANESARRPAAQARAEFRSAARALKRAQPAMGPFLRWAAEWRALARSPEPRAAARVWLRRERVRLRGERAGLARIARSRFVSFRRVVTLSRSRSVLWALSAVSGSRRPEAVSVLESLPGGEGRSFARELRHAGLRARVIRDADGPRAVGTADLLLIGADAVFGDRSVVHKVGTRRLARAARSAGVPVVVVAGRSKFVPGPPPRRAWPSRFDRTTARYISEFWTDRGVRRGGAPRRRPARHTPL